MTFFIRSMGSLLSARMGTVQVATAAASILAVVAVGVVAIVLIRNWHRRWVHAEERTPHHLLAEFRELHAKGDLSREEFERLRRKLTPAIQHTTEPDDKPAAADESTDGARR